MWGKKKIGASKRRSLQHRGTKCLNCGHSLDKSDIYCPYCSQLNSNKRLSAKDFFAEFLGSIIVYDSRLRNTIRDLLFHPGRMTENYIKGQRVKYANPFRFFFSVSIIFILVQGFTSSLSPSEERNKPLELNISQDKTDSILKGLETEQIKNPDVEELKKLNNYFSDKKSTDSLVAINYNTTLENSNTGKFYNFKNSPIYYEESALDTLSNLEGYIKRMTLYWEFYSTNKIKNPREALDSLNHNNTLSNRWSYSRVIAGNKIVEDPNAFLDYIFVKIPFFLFFFSPVFALFFKLFYPKKFNYMDHLIFIFHIFSFIFLFMLIFEIPSVIWDTEFFNAILFLLLGPSYFYLALRNFYKQNRFLSFFKFGLLSIVFGICFTISATLFLAMSAAMY